MPMKLMTKALEKRFAQVGRQDVEDPIVIAKYFNPCGSQTWYATEYYPDCNDCFGYLDQQGPGECEWGYFSLTEFAQTPLPPFGLTVERDLYWTEKPFSEVKLSWSESGK